MSVWYFYQVLRRNTMKVTRATQINEAMLLSILIIYINMFWTVVENFKIIPWTTSSKDSLECCRSTAEKSSFVCRKIILTNPSFFYAWYLRYIFDRFLKTHFCVFVTIEKLSLVKIQFFSSPPCILCFWTRCILISYSKENYT